MSPMRMVTIGGLLVGAIGIAVLWMAGVPFPFYPPPGILILGTGALVVAVWRSRFAPLVGAALGLFIIVGFLASPTGVSNLLGDAGTMASVGQVLQQAGMIVALVAGTLAARAEFGAARQRVAR